MRKIISIITPVLICFLVGFLGGQSQETSLATWYTTLVKSPLTPPNIAFPIAWSILYLFMGISIGLIINSKTQNKRFLVILFCTQLAFNFLWSIVFFKMQNPLLGFIDIIILNILVVFYTIKSYHAVKASSILFLPYAVWILFASYLNFYIMINN